MTMRVRNVLFLVGFAAAASAGAIACSSSKDDPAPGGDHALGQLSAALSAVGPDGATYTLPATSTATIYSGGSFFLSTGLAGSATLSFNMPTGPYTMTLSPGSGLDAGQPWTLTRTADGGSSSVVAYLVDAQPYSFSILPNQTTSTTFHFVVPSVGDVVLSTGTLSAAVQVDGGSAEAGHATVTGTVPLTNISNSSNAALNALFAPWDSPSTAVSIQITLSDAVYASVDSACVDGTAHVTGTSNVDAGTDKSTAALWNEMNGAAASICLDDNLNGNDGAVWVYLFRNGAPQTPTFVSVLGADAGTSRFDAYIQLVPASPLYTGSVAHMGALGLPVTMPIGYVQAFIYPGATPDLTLTGSTGTLSIQVTP
jgi:hypothetical protein